MSSFSSEKTIAPKRKQSLLDRLHVKPSTLRCADGDDAKRILAPFIGLRRGGPISASLLEKARLLLSEEESYKSKALDDFTDAVSILVHVSIVRYECLSIILHNVAI